MAHQNFTCQPAVSSTNPGWQPPVRELLVSQVIGAQRKGVFRSRVQGPIGCMSVSPAKESHFQSKRAIALGGNV